MPSRRVKRAYPPVGLVGVTLSLAFTTTKPARADEAACFAASENEIALRKQGKLTEALKQLVICAAPSCPAEVSAECGRRIGDSSYAYVTIESDDYLVKVEVDLGGANFPLTQITAFENNPYAIAIDTNNVYFTNAATSGDVRQVSKNGTSSSQGTILSAANTDANGVATDGVNVYFAANNAVYKCPVGAAGAAQTIATSQSGASFLAVDSTSVYWTNSGAGTVMKLTPK